MKRKDFLKGLGAAVFFPTIIPASALGKNGFVAPSNRIQMGSIGLGGMGSGNSKNFLGHKEVQMVALCDPCMRSNQYGYGHRDTKGAEVFKEVHKLNDAKIYTDFRELIARGDIDAVATATPDHWHALIGIACANAGIDVYGEKPLTRTVEEGRRLSDAVRRNGIIWQTGSWQRFGRDFIHAAELIRNGAIGKVKHVSIRLPANNEIKPLSPEPVPSNLDWEMWLGPAAYADYHPFRAFTTWRFFSDYSAGKIADWGAHHLDITQWALGYDFQGAKTIEPLETKWQNDGFYDLPTVFNVRFTYERGEVVDMTCRKDAEEGIVFTGENGTIWIDRGRFASDPITLVNEKIPVDGVRLNGREYTGDHIRNFLWSVRNRKATATDIETAHRTNTGCLLGEIAYMTGRKITWDWKTETIIGDSQASRLLTRSYRGDWKLA